MNKLIQKITVGFVVQTYDTERNTFTEQTFIAGDDVSWEDGAGNLVDGPENQPYMSFDMIQPEVENVSKHITLEEAQVGQRVLAYPTGHPNDEPREEFQGVIIGINKDGEYISVKDQDDDVFDLDPEQVFYIKD